MAWAKVAYAVTFLTNGFFVYSSMRDLPAFLTRGPAAIPVRDALFGRAVRQAGKSIVGASLFGALMSLYFVGPLAAPLLVKAIIGGSFRARLVAGAAALALVADTVLPQPTHASALVCKINGALFKPVREYFTFKSISSKPVGVGKFG